MKTEDPKDKIKSLFNDLNIESKGNTARPAFQPIIIGNNNILVQGDFVQNFAHAAPEQ